MPKVTFFPVGNADTCLIDLAGGEKILFDYADRRDPDEESDKRINLSEALRDDLKQADRDYFDVAAFTHLDQDHYDGTSDFFHLEHDKKYQGEGRIKMNEMWVPAAVITEKMSEDESKIIQKEARYRLRKQTGILIFSRPERLKEWLEKNDIDFEAVKHLIVDAGRTVPGLTKEEHGVEFFVHSPFAKRQNDCEVEIRNDDAIVVQAAFLVDGAETSMQLFSDLRYEIISDIVEVTKWHENEDRLLSDIFKVPHHCSYTALGPEKGDDTTEPEENVKWLFETQCREGCVLIATSDPIPSDGSKDDEDVQPPHRQAANYYKGVAKDKDGEFVVTMEHPKKSSPEPIVIEITKKGGEVLKKMAVGPAVVTAVHAPRAG
jgi:beta-lactamase superfamily II metal-dependent hydrolase